MRFKGAIASHAGKLKRGTVQRFKDGIGEEVVEAGGSMVKGKAQFDLPASLERTRVSPVWKPVNGIQNTALIPVPPPQKK